MTTAIKRRRGTTAQHSTFTGLEGELTIDTTKDTVVVHDGVTAGGFPLAKETGSAIAATTLSASGAFSANGGATLGNATGDALTINSSAVSIPNGLNFDSNTLVIDATNNQVGIGTASPSTQLHLYKNTSASATALTIQNAATAAGSYATLQFDAGAVTSQLFSDAGGGVYAQGAVLRTTSNHPLIFGTNNTERMRIDSSGNVGIGTSSPNSYSGFTTLTLNNASTGSVLDWNVNGTRTFTTLTTATTVNIGSLTAIPLTFRTADTERMRIDSSGKVFIGKTGATAAAGNGLWLDSSGGINYTVTAGGYAAGFFRTDGTNVGAIQISSTSTSYLTSSDYRLKENIAPMTGALAKVSALKPCTYTWKADGSAGQGFIAHELQEIVPECVVGEKDAVNEDGSIKAQGIDTSFLVATLTSAIQEQQAIITDLKARIETLENK